MRVLTGDDMRKSVAVDDVIHAVEEAMILYEGNEYLMPARSHVDLRGNTFLLMASFIPGVFGTKLVSVFPGNVNNDIPVIQGVMILNNGQTGVPLAIFDGATLTAMRTGAVGAVGVKYLSAENATKLGIVGAGVQGFHLAYYTSHIHHIDTVYLFDLEAGKSRLLLEKLKELKPHLSIIIASSVSELLENSQVIITATTSTIPVVPDVEDLLAGKTFIGIGSFKPDVREYPDALMKLIDRVFVDSRQAAKEAGDLLIPLDKGLLKPENLYTIGKLIMKTVLPGEKKTRFFKSVGMALFDLVVAKYIYSRAVENKIGKEVIL